MTTNLRFSERLLTSSVLIAVTALILFSTNAYVFGLEVTVFAALALFEFFTLLKREKIPVMRLFGVSMGAIIPLVVTMELGYTHSGEVLFLVLGCLFLFVLKFFHDSNQSLIGISLTLFGILYISWFLSFLIKIRFLEGGALWVLYLLAVTKAGDIGAYIVGSLFGHHTLIPHISPKKSVEGSLGGLCASLGASVALKDILPLHFIFSHILILGFLIGVVGQIGDLSESLMKRFCRSKDSGHLLPGFGGVLDAVDSILFTAPIFYFHLKIYL